MPKPFFFFLFYSKICSVLWSAFLQSAFIIVVLRSFQICSIQWLKPRIKNLKVEVQKGNFNISKYMFFRKLSCFWKKISTTLENCSVTLKKPTISGRKSCQFPAFITPLKPWNYSRRLRLDVSLRRCFQDLLCKPGRQEKPLLQRKNCVNVVFNVNKTSTICACQKL